MKKFYLTLISLIVVFCFCTTGITSVFAEAETEEIKMATSMNSVLVPGEIVYVYFQAHNPGEDTGAKLNLYLDGHAFGSPETTSDLIISGECKSGFTFVVPHDIDPYYQHNLLVEMVCENGQALYSSNIFTVKPKEIEVKLSTTMEDVLAAGNTYKVYCDINCPGEVMGAKVTLFLDSAPIPGSGSPYFVIGGETKENFDFKVPDNIDAYYEHNLLVELICENGQVIYSSNMFKIGENNGSEAESQPSAPSSNATKEIGALVIPATINYDVKAYKNSSLSGFITTIPKGTVVEYMNPDNHNSMSKARVRLLDSNTVCWVPMNAVTISQEDFTIEDTLTDADREGFVNSVGYSSKTDYLIWVNKQRQRLTVFMGKQGSWKALKTFPVATGKNSTPTPTTVCEYTQYQRWNTATYVCDPVLYFYDGYAIHNQPVSHSGKVIDPTIGKPASAGCIRMLIDDVRWVYSYVPVGTTVVLY